MQYYEQRAITDDLLLIEKKNESQNTWFRKKTNVW